MGVFGPALITTGVLSSLAIALQGDDGGGVKFP